MQPESRAVVRAGFPGTVFPFALSLGLELGLS